MTQLLMFLIVETRPDIAFATFVISHFAKNLFWQYTEAMKTIMRYLKAIRILGITYGGEERGDLIIKDYFNLNWAGDSATSKLTSGFVFILNRGPVS